MRLIIPGAAGFIGVNFLSTLSQEELCRFEQIILVDILQYDVQKIPAAFLEHPNVSFINGSIYDQEILAEIIKNGDIVLHLAVEENTFDNPQTKNTVGILEYLDYLANKKIRRFIFLSTADIYGINNSSNLQETDVVKPTIPYAANKVTIEAHLQVYKSLHNFPAVIFRPVTIFGPHQQPGWLVPRVITRALEDISVQITGDGSTKRNWIFVNDVGTLLKKVIFYTKNGIDGEVFNIGTGSEQTVLEITKFILETLGKSEDLIEFIPSRPGDIPRQITNAEKARSTFDWKPETDFYSNLKSTIQWYKDNSHKK